jgi:hypothetical protein
MIQAEFNILFANVTAITSQVFAIQCEQFASDLASEQRLGGVVNVSAFDPGKYIAQTNYKEILDSGYESIPSLKTELEVGWNNIDLATLNSLVANLPENLPDISKKITVDQFKLWISYVLGLSDDNPLYLLHQYFMSYLANDFDDVSDIIREAIAFDELSGLIEHANNIGAGNISLNDLITAATIQSFNVLKWLIKRACLNDGQVVELLESNIQDLHVFECVYKIIKPTERQHFDIMSIAVMNKTDDVVMFLDKVRGG